MLKRSMTWPIPMVTIAPTAAMGIKRRAVAPIIKLANFRDRSYSEELTGAEVHDLLRHEHGVV